MSKPHAFGAACLTTSGLLLVAVAACSGGGGDLGSAGDAGSSGASSSGASSPGDGSPPPVGAACAAAQASAAKGFAARTLQVAGVKDSSYASRTYGLFVPETHGTGKLPVVFAFHGNGGDGAGLRGGFGLEGAAKGGAVIVYPDGFGGWDLESPADDNDDIRFVKAMLASLETSHCIDTSRVFATGFSNGGFFANQLGCKVGASVFRGIASHGGGGPYGAGNEYDQNGDLICAGQPVAAAIFHGTDDGAVGVDNAQRSRDHWVGANGCTGTSKGTSPSPCLSFDGCARAVTYCEVEGLGHSIWEQGAMANWAFFREL